MSWLRTPGFLGILLGMAIDARAIIFYSADNDHNNTDPGGGLPWQNVVEVRSSSGITGSGVYLGNRYVLTAAHVGPTETIRINSTDFSLEPAAPILIGTADMKLLRLQSDPGLGNILLNTVAGDDFGDAYLVGYGVGRSSSLLSSSPISWGDASTATKRWGTNSVDGFGSGSGSFFLRTQFNTNAGSNEAALALYDSGSALFRRIGLDWFLVGLGFAVGESPISSTSYAYSTAEDQDYAEDDSYFVRISSYANAQNVLGGVVVPEPGTGHLLMFALGVYSVVRRRIS